MMQQTLKTTWYLLLVAGVLALAGGPAASGAIIIVQVKDGQVRATPSFLAQVVATLHDGDRVTVLNQSGGWAQVSTGRVRGWMHPSVLTAQTLSFQAGSRNAPLAASSDELSLAGKGFNQQVESAYRTRHPNQDYTWVNRMETWDVSPGEIRDFLMDGGLSPKGGER